MASKPRSILTQPGRPVSAKVSASCSAAHDFRTGRRSWTATLKKPCSPPAQRTLATLRRGYCITSMQAKPRIPPSLVATNKRKPPSNSDSRISSGSMNGWYLSARRTCGSIAGQRSGTRFVGTEWIMSGLCNATARIARRTTALQPHSAINPDYRPARNDRSPRIHLPRI